MPLEFGKTNTMVNQVIKKADETNMNHKKRDIPLDEIDMNKDNEYIFGYSDIDFLAKEIEDSGFHGAIEVYAMPDGRYEIMSGHRRYLACKKLGYKTIPCIVSEAADPATIAEQIIMSNIHHRDMTPLRMARAINYYAENVLKVKGKDYQGKKRTTLAEKFNMSESNIQRHMNILKLIPEIQELCDNKSFPITYFTETVAQCPEKMQKKLYDKLLQIAPDGKIEELSKKMVEMQLESIKAEEQRVKEAKKRVEEPPYESSPQKKEVLEHNNMDEREETDGFIKYDSTGSNEMQNLDEPATVGYNLDTLEDGNYAVSAFAQEDGQWDHLENDVPDEVVENKVKYHIERIEHLVEEDVKYQDKAELVVRLRRLADMLEKQK